MIRVHPTIYRALWIMCAVFSAVLLASPLLLTSGAVHVEDRHAFSIQMTFFGIVGVIALPYCMWRLLRPLRAKPSE